MSLNARSLRRLLWAAAAGLSAAAVAVSVWGFRGPGPDRFLAGTGTETEADATLDPVAASGADAGRQFGPSVSLHAPTDLLARPLRGPLFAPPPPPRQVAPTPPPPPLRLRLLGTVVEDDHSRAIVMASAGQIEIIPLGTVVDDATITSITDRNITVLYHGAEQVLTIEK